MPSSDLAVRFFQKTKQSANGCLEWTASYCAVGYGRIKVDGRLRMATHVAIYLSNGFWPKAGVDVCHTCDNPRCVNVDHLFIGTRLDNVQDCQRKGRFVSNPPTSKLALMGADDLYQGISTHGSIMAFARSLGVGPQTVRRRMERLGITHPRSQMIGQRTRPEK